MSVVLIPDSILHCATNTPRGTTGRKVRRDRLRRCDAVSCPGSTAPHRSEPLRGARACRRERLRERGTRTTPTVSCSATSALVANIAASPYRDAVCAAAAAAGSYAWVKFFDFLASKNVLEKEVDTHNLWTTIRPHMAAIQARVIAALVPALQFVRLLAIGNGWWKNENAVKAVSREGSAEELLRGPLYYVIVLMLMTLGCWRDSPIGLISIGLMCAGDGMADVVGRRLGGAKLPFNRKKSWAGSIAMFTCGSLLSIGFVCLFRGQGYFLVEDSSILYLVASAAFVSTTFEALPVTDVLDDNIVVPASAVLTMMALGFH